MFKYLNDRGIVAMCGETGTKTRVSGGLWLCGTHTPPKAYNSCRCLFENKIEHIHGPNKVKHFSIPHAPLNPHVCVPSLIERVRGWPELHLSVF